MILSIKATRKSQTMQDMPDSEGGRGTKIYEFEVPFDGPAPTVIVDCGSAHAFDLFQVRGDALPHRPCPLRPKGAVAGPDGPPVNWIDETGRLKASCFQPTPDRKLSPSDLFVVVGINACNACPKATGGTVGLKNEQDAILAAFHAQLGHEDFTGFELDDADRDASKWKIDFSEVEIISQ